MSSRIKHILIKEFRQVFRDKKMKIVLFVMPLFQILLFGNAVSTDVDNIQTAVYDMDNSSISREIARRFDYSSYFDIVKYVSSDDEARALIDKSAVMLLLRFEHGFSKDYSAGKPASIQLVIDGTDSNTARIVLSYTSQVLEAYQNKILLERVDRLAGGENRPSVVDLRARPWFNGNLESRWFYVPGISALILFILSMLLSAMAIVREKEVGTMEQIIVSPIKPYEFILGKLTPFAIVGIIATFLVTTLGVIIFHVPVRGNLIVLFLGACLFLFNTLGIGLLISTRANTQQEALMSMFFIAQPSVLLSGFIFPIDNMPLVVQWITVLNPLRYYLIIIRSVFLKGVGLTVLWPEMLALLVLGSAIIALSMAAFRQRLG